MQAHWLEMFQTGMFIILGLAGLLALLAGLLFVIVPGWAMELNTYSSRWVSLRRKSYPLERLHSIEPWVYRHHRLMGATALLGAGYTLYHLAFSYRHEYVLSIVGASPLADWLLSAAWWFILLSTLAIVVLASLLALRPSALKAPEAWLNQWLSTRRVMAWLEQPYFGADGLVSKHPRLFGLLLLLAATYLLITMVGLGASRILVTDLLS